jgi:putative addiction module component (TIGR02574 family)
VATKTQDVIERALRLTQAQRAEVAERLLASLEPEEVDQDVEVAWQQEIARRVAEVKSGKAKLIPWETIRKQAREKLRETR